MITILNVQFEQAKKEFNAYYDGALIARGTVEFTTAEEQETAKKTIAAAVAAGYGCKESEIYITLHKYYGNK